MHKFLYICVALSACFLLSSCTRFSPPKKVTVGLVNISLTSPEPELIDGDRIVGGVETAPNEFPWLVPIHFREGTSGYFCGGSIISSEWVMSAGHCCKSPAYTYVINAGVFDLTSTAGSQERKAQRVIPHPSYSSQTMYNDLCLIQVSSPFDFSDPKVQPIGLAKQNQETNGVTATVTGWGLTSGSASNQPSKARKVSITGIPNSGCRLYMLPHENAEAQVGNDTKFDLTEAMGYDLADSQVCAGGNGKSACYGDSGGPYMIWDSSSQNFLEAGVVSGGATCGGPGVYTRVSSYHAWIAQVTGIGSD